MFGEIYALLLPHQIQKEPAPYAGSGDRLRYPNRQVGEKAPRLQLRLYIKGFSPRMRMLCGYVLGRDRSRIRRGHTLRRTALPAPPNAFLPKDIRKQKIAHLHAAYDGGRDNELSLLYLRVPQTQEKVRQAGLDEHLPQAVPFRNGRQSDDKPDRAGDDSKEHRGCAENNSHGGQVHRRKRPFGRERI